MRAVRSSTQAAMRMLVGGIVTTRTNQRRRTRGASGIFTGEIGDDIDAAMTMPFATATIIAAAPFVGCFGASAVQRRLEGKSFFFLRSRCDACGRQLEFRELVPIFSWL